MSDQIITEYVRVFPHFTKDIELMLGLVDNNGYTLKELIDKRAEAGENLIIEKSRKTGKFRGKRPVEIRAGIDNLLVYCDLKRGKQTLESVGSDALTKARKVQAGKGKKIIKPKKKTPKKRKNNANKQTINIKEKKPQVRPRKNPLLNW